MGLALPIWGGTPPNGGRGGYFSSNFALYSEAKPLFGGGAPDPPLSEGLILLRLEVGSCIGALVDSIIGRQ